MTDDFSLKGEVISILQTIDAPQSDNNLIDAHVVEIIDVDKGLVEITLVLPKDLPREERFAVEDAIYDQIEELPGVKELKVHTLSPEAMAALQNGEAPTPSTPSASAGNKGSAAPKSSQASPSSAPAVPPSAPIDGVGQIIAVASGKGGVGKSTVAANLALALQHQGFRVGILDIDIYGPSLPTLLGVNKKPAVIERRIQPIETHGIRLMSLGFLMDDDAPAIWRGPIVTGIIRQFLRDVDWSGIDYLIVDMPPGTGDAQLAFAQTVPVDGAIIVSTPSDLALIDAARGLKMFETLNIDLVGIVENMSVFICPHCHEASHIFGKDTVEKEAKRLNTTLLGSIPLDLEVRQTGDAGSPIMLKNPSHPVSQAFIELADKVATLRPLGSKSNDTKKSEKKGLFSFLKN